MFTPEQRALLRLDLLERARNPLLCLKQLSPEDSYT